ncbi:hypothetical protein J6590_019243 [Homalodisca vitripennis]|nr:hypothetical protein J6590_019243 [Homalodisca vitripennis]
MVAPLERGHHLKGFIPLLNPVSAIATSTPHPPDYIATLTTLLILRPLFSHVRPPLIIKITTRPESKYSLVVIGQDKLAGYEHHRCKAWSCKRCFK